MNYIALTIGPIYETMSYCKKTRELWVGSYFFSYFMKKLITKLSEEDSEIKIDFLVPFVKDEKKNALNEKLEVGVFHDRFIATSESSKDDLKNLLISRINETLDELANIINANEQSKYNEALKEYFQYHYIIATKDELLENTGKENVIFAIDAILDSLELQQKFTFENKSNIVKPKDSNSSDKINPIAKLQYEANRLKKDLGLKIKFKSIPRIAIANIKKFELANLMQEKYLDKNRIYRKKMYKLFREAVKDKYDNDDLYDTFYKEFEKDESFKPHHKYYAVIQADGDKMGKTIRNNPEKIGKISKNIFTYITQEEEGISDINKLFNDFGGMLIYAGGDDLLGFAPISGKDDKTVFELIERLSSKFKKVVRNDVSLSFGVSINYYKSPMIEAIKQSGYLLFDVAKKHNTEEKSGSVALSLTKHSGQTFDGVFFLNDDSYISYKEIFKDELNGNITLPHNIQYSLKSLEFLIVDLFEKKSKKSDEEIVLRINALFKNLVKDSSQNENMKSSIDRIKDYLLKFKPKSKDEFQKFITQLAIIKFLRGDK